MAGEGDGAHRASNHDHHQRGKPNDGRDADGEAFHEETNIWLEPGAIVPITYYHGFGPDEPDAMQENPVIVGRAKYIGVTERGHMFDPRLDPDEELAKRLLEAEPENVKASSGAVSHLVRMGKAGLIDVWPVGELAMFDVNDWRLPANDYAVIEKRAADKSEPEDTAKARGAQSVSAGNNGSKNYKVLQREALQFLGKLLVGDMK